ncbi:MAG: spk, partial [Modestobacter sp.]|nr:spk [Modestobacter sp.]
PGPTTSVSGARPGVAPRSAAVRPGVPPHIRRRRARLGVALVLLLAITIGAVGWWLGEGRFTDVPTLVGQPEKTAVGLVQEAGLSPVFADEQFSENVPEGTVIAADPTQGRLVRGSDVELVVSKGPERFSVAAELVGKPLDAVQAALAEQPTPLVPASGFSDTVPAGSVISFDPPAGTDLKRDQSVTVVVSSGRAPVEVPDVVGQSPAAAETNLEERGFTVKREEGRSADVATGQVMRVTPGPGDGAKPYGSTVTITVSVGLPQVTVPDVKDKSQDEAVAALTAVGLKADAETFIAGDRVFQQSPKAGDVVDQGSTVRILISFG